MNKIANFRLLKDNVPTFFQFAVRHRRVAVRKALKAKFHFIMINTTRMLANTIP